MPARDTHQRVQIDPPALLAWSRQLYDMPLMTPFLFQSLPLGGPDPFPSIEIAPDDKRRKASPQAR